MLSGAYWIAVALVRMRTAPLDAWYSALVLSVATMPSWGGYVDDGAYTSLLHFRDC